MPTPIGGTEPYATVADVITQCDVRTLGDFLSDTGTRLAQQEVEDSEFLIDALGQASGDLEAACMAGGRYTLADLQALTGNSRRILANVVVGLTLEQVFDRRPDRKPPGLGLRKVEKAHTRLESLRKGEWIFALKEQADAGRQSHRRETSYDVESRNLSTFIARRFFGRRGNRIDTQWR